MHNETQNFEKINAILIYSYTNYAVMIIHSLLPENVLRM